MRINRVLFNNLATHLSERITTYYGDTSKLAELTLFKDNLKKSDPDLYLWSQDKITTEEYLGRLKNA